MARKHREMHRMQHVSWLRAAVLGANDGIISTSSLILGVASSRASHVAILTAGVAGLVAGAMSMAAGEYVSVSSQADIEHADLERESRELAINVSREQAELASIYMERGLERRLAEQVASQLMHHDALAAHAQDELGISKYQNARPVQAALTSALTFSFGAALPLLAAWLSPVSMLSDWVSGASLLFLAALGGLAAKTGGASVLKGTVRVTFWGALAMGVTAGIGMLFGGGVAG